jgi:FkbM family methyltransferase
MKHLRDDYENYIIQEVRETYSVLGLNWPNRILRFGTNKYALDLGSNIGGFSLVFGNNFNFTLAVEPNSVAIARAGTLLDSGYSSKMRIMHGALSDKDGVKVSLRKVYVGETAESKDFTTVTWDQEEVENTNFLGRLGETAEEVLSISLPTILKVTGKSVDFLKCDIEGAEYETFMNHDLAAINFIVLELHYTALGQKKVGELISHFEKYFDYFHPEDREKFHSWPPPEILRLINKRHPSKLLRISGKLVSHRITFHLQRIRFKK